MKHLYGLGCGCTSAGLGKIYPEEGPGRVECADGTWTDSIGPGACSSHGGYKKTPCNCPPGEPSGDCFAIWLPIDQIQTDEERFQNRDAAFSEESVERIVSAYNPDKFDPVKVWQDPEDGKVYMLSGHSRLEAMRRMEQPRIPARFFEGSEQQAMLFARLEANRLGTESVGQNFR